MEASSSASSSSTHPSALRSVVVLTTRLLVSAVVIASGRRLSDCLDQLLVALGVSSGRQTGEAVVVVPALDVGDLVVQGLHGLQQ